MNAPFRIMTTPEKVRLRVEDFLLLDQSGAFADYTKTELIEGEIYVMNAQYSRHAQAKTDLAFALMQALSATGSDLRVTVEVATRIGEHSLPEPDIVLTSHRGEGVVPLETVALIVEVSDTTLGIDMGRKLRIYAEAGVPEYWVVDVEGRVIHQMWGPSGEGYMERREHRFGAVIEAATLSGVMVDTNSVI